MPSQNWKERLFYEKNQLLYRELEMTQRVMDKYDGLSFQIKGWEVSVWSALMVIALQFNKPMIAYIALLVPAVFWFIDSLYKTYREGYKNRRNEIAKFINSKDYDDSFKKLNMKFPIPVFPVHKVTDTLKTAFHFHVLILHATLIAITLFTIVILLW